MSRLLSLDDPVALDAEVVGHKAAGLARARAAGLPVLPGFVVPVEESAGALREARRVHARSSAAAARLAIAREPWRAATVRGLAAAARELGMPLIVRSSTDRDADPRWAGAFATYTEVSEAELGVAVQGCWASAFARDALGRAEATGAPPGEVRMAVLVQRWVAFDAGGTAELRDDGSVRVLGAAARPEALLSGRIDGEVVEVRASGVTQGLPGVSDRVLRAVAELARRTGDAVGAPVVEWGARGDRIRLLQARPAAAAPDRISIPSSRRRALPPIAGRLAELAVRYPAPLGDVLVLPWAAGTPDVPEIPPLEAPDPGEALDEVMALADHLTGGAWGLPVERARSRSATAIRGALGPEPESALASLARLRPVDPAAAARLIGLVRGIGRTLARRSSISADDLVWRLSPGEVRAAGRGTVVGGRSGPGRWEPFLASVASANGHTWVGTAAAPGIGAGRLRFLDAGSLSSRREVLVVPEPVPAIAPLLWGAAGLVAARGSAAAHVCEVARSLGVPTVVGLELPAEADGAIGAVDGTAGTVSVLPREASRAPARVAG